MDISTATNKSPIRSSQFQWTVPIFGLLLIVLYVLLIFRFALLICAPVERGAADCQPVTKLFGFPLYIKEIKGIVGAESAISDEYPFADVMRNARYILLKTEAGEIKLLESRILSEEKNRFQIEGIRGHLGGEPVVFDEPADLWIFFPSLYVSILFGWFSHSIIPLTGSPSSPDSLK
ncbi:MAG: hypothetical protein AAF633_23570 [Chloroflexota bacterium]